MPLHSIAGAASTPPPAAVRGRFWFHIVEETEPRDPSPVSVRLIQSVVCDHFNVTRNELASHRRAKFITIPRQIAMYLCRSMTPLSFPTIARRFGDRDHSTIMFSYRKIERLLPGDPDMADDIAQITAVIEAKRGN